MQSLDREAEYIAAEHERFQSLVTRLVDPEFATCTLVEWLHKRVVERKTQAGAIVGWSTFERDRPALAQASLRFLNEYGKQLPAGVRLTERFRQPVASDDWVALIEDFSIGFLKTSADPRDQQAWDDIGLGSARWATR